jgi:hypothetical protein
MDVPAAGEPGVGEREGGKGAHRSSSLRSAGRFAQAL